MLRQRRTLITSRPVALASLLGRPSAAGARALVRHGQAFSTNRSTAFSSSRWRSPLLLAAVTAMSAGAAFGLHRHRSAFALQPQPGTEAEEYEDEGYQRLLMGLMARDDGEDGEGDLADAIVFEPEEEVKEEEKEKDEEELLPASRVLGAGRAKIANEEAEARRQQLEAHLHEHIRSWAKFEKVCSQGGGDDGEEGEEQDKPHAGAKVVLRYPPWMQPGESNEVAQFTILGASPHGQKDGVVDMLTMLTTTPPVHRMRDLYEFHRGIRDEIGKQARIVKPRMRWLVAGRPALGFVTAFTGWGKTLVSTYVVTAYNKTGYVLVFNTIHDGEAPLPQCFARHQEESDEAFEYILRTVTFRPAPPPSPSASLPSSSFFLSAYEKTK